MSRNGTAESVGFRPCILIPTYENAATVRNVVCQARQHLPDVLVVDDGSGPPARATIATLEREQLARVRFRPINGGKGAAVKTGFAFADELGYTHAFQVDADGQHDLSRIPAFLEAAATHRDTLVLGYPAFGPSAPRSRIWARRISQFWVNVETGGRVITDPMIGFRVYPLRAALRAGATGDRMDLDIEIAVRMVWAGTPVMNLPVGVRYLSCEEGGVSHFRLIGDNARISWLHTRLTILALLRRLRPRTASIR